MNKSSLTFKPLPSFLNFLGMCCYDFSGISTVDLGRFQHFLPHWKPFLLQIVPEAPVQEFCEQLQNLVASEDLHKQAVLEFNRLFKNPAPLVVLWESVWLSSDHALFGEQTVAARGWYRTFGLELPTSGEAADHIGLELIFFANLLVQASAHAKNNAHSALVDFDSAVDTDSDVCKTPTSITEEKPWEFWDAHLGKWGAKCLGELSIKAENSFWQSLLQVSHQLLVALGKTA